MMNLKKIYLVTGIDTDAGKSYATGYIASKWHNEGKRVITQKLIQTGCRGISEDIETHRRIMGLELLPEDIDGTTCPIRLTYPASPDLAARMDKTRVDLELVDKSTRILLDKYDVVLVEGAGGIMVPIDGFYTTLDYAAERKLPMIVVTNPRLGSINHTLLTIQACLSRNLEIDVLAYNLFSETAGTITEDTRRFLKSYIAEHIPRCEFMEIPRLAI